MTKCSLLYTLLGTSILSGLLSSCDVVASSYKPSQAGYHDHNHILEERRREEERIKRFLNNANMYVRVASDEMAKMVMNDINQDYGKHPNHQIISYIQTDERNFIVSANIKLLWQGHSGRVLSTAGPCEVTGTITIHFDKNEIYPPIARFVHQQVNYKVKTILSKLEQDGKPGLRDIYEIEIY